MDKKIKKALKRIDEKNPDFRIDWQCKSVYKLDNFNNCFRFYCKFQGLSLGLVQSIENN